METESPRNKEQKMDTAEPGASKSGSDTCLLQVIIRLFEHLLFDMWVIFLCWQSCGDIYILSKKRNFT